MRRDSGLVVGCRLSVVNSTTDNRQLTTAAIISLRTRRGAVSVHRMLATHIQLAVDRAALLHDQ